MSRLFSFIATVKTLRTACTCFTQPHTVDLMHALYVSGGESAAELILVEGPFKANPPPPLESCTAKRGVQKEVFDWHKHQGPAKIIPGIDPIRHFKFLSLKRCAKLSRCKMWGKNSPAVAQIPCLGRLEIVPLLNVGPEIIPHFYTSATVVHEWDVSTDG